MDRRTRGCLSRGIAFFRIHPCSRGDRSPPPPKTHSGTLATLRHGREALDGVFGRRGWTVLISSATIETAAMSRRETHPHDKHLVSGWQTCRRGMGEVVSDSSKRELVLRWIEDKLPVLKSPFLRKWQLIIRGDEPELSRELQSTDNFFDLPQTRQDEWGRLVQSHPFAPLFARDRASA